MAASLTSHGTSTVLSLNGSDVSNRRARSHPETTLVNISATRSATDPSPAVAAGAPISLSRSHQFRALRSDRIVKTAAQLSARISERFPQAGLKHVADELQVVAQEAIQTCARIRRPLYLVRLGVAILFSVLLGLLIGIGVHVRWLAGQEILELEHFVTTLEAGLGSIFFLGAIVVFLVSLERRTKRERLLVAMRELRALAHIVDMHQLTKDPESIHRHFPTKSSPQRSLSTFLLGRYLDYCSELLSLISKIGAFYVQEFPDSAALAAADQLSTLTNGLSRGIWQKIMILEQAIEHLDPHPTPSVSAADGNNQV